TGHVIAIATAWLCLQAASYPLTSNDRHRSARRQGDPPWRHPLQRPSMYIECRSMTQGAAEPEPALPATPSPAAPVAAPAQGAFDDCGDGEAVPVRGMGRQHRPGHDPGDR